MWEAASAAYSLPGDVISEHENDLVKNKNFLRLHEKFDPLTGYNGVSYYNKVTGQLIIASSGTNPMDWDLDTLKGPKDLLGNDGAILLMEKAPQVYAAKLFYYEALNKVLTNPDDYHKGVQTIAFTGHSLGGYISQVLAYQTGNSAVTFNSPGIDPWIDEERRKDPAGFQQKYADLVLNYTMKGDMINEYGNDIGTNIVFQGEKTSIWDSTIDFVSKKLRNHSLENWKNYIHQDGYIYKDGKKAAPRIGSSDGRVEQQAAQGR